jgi:hypothetical protein
VARKPKLTLTVSEEDKRLLEQKVQLLGYRSISEYVSRMARMEDSSRGGVSGGMIRQELAEARAELPDIDQQIKALELQIALLRKKRQAKLTKIERYQALAEQLDSVIRDNP